MKNYRIALVTLAATLFFSSTSLAKSPEDQIKRIKTEAALTDAAKSLEKSCGTTIGFSVDWTGFDDEKYRRVSVSGYCRVLSTAIAGLCKHGEHTKAFVRQRVKQLTCKPGVDGHRQITTSKDGCHSGCRLQGQELRQVCPGRAPAETVG